MKTLGGLVKKWREESGLSLAQMARRCGPGVTYQNIQQLEDGKAKQPRYLGALAKAMGTTVDNLLALRSPPPLAHADAHPSPPPPTVDQLPPEVLEMARSLAEITDANTRELILSAVEFQIQLALEQQEAALDTTRKRGRGR